jgi:hypothetical protein
MKGILQQKCEKHWKNNRRPLQKFSAKFALGEKKEGKLLRRIGFCAFVHSFSGVRSMHFCKCAEYLDKISALKGGPKNTATKEYTRDIF